MLDPAVASALAAARAAVTTLDRRCCEPGRSPRMAALAAAIDDVGARLDRGDATDAVLRSLEQAGGMVGALQVGCCAPNRLPLYAEVLDRLTAVQLGVTGGHQAEPSRADDEGASEQS